MDFWKEFSKTVTSAAEGTVKGAEKLTDMAKLKYKISSLNTKLDESYNTLGRLKYSEKNGEKVAREMYNSIFDRIDELNAQVAEAESELFDLMNFVACPVCGTRMKKDCKYCPKCGDKI